MSYETDLAAADAAIADAFATALTLIPRAAGRYSAGADPERDPVETRGILSILAGTREFREPGQTGTRTGTMIAKAHAEAEIDRAHRAALPWAPREGDHLAGADPATGETMTFRLVAPPMPLAAGGLCLSLEPIAEPAP